MLYNAVMVKNNGVFSYYGNCQVGREKNAKETKFHKQDI